MLTFDYTVKAAKPFCRVEPWRDGVRLSITERDGSEIMLTMSEGAAQRLFQAYGIAHEHGGLGFVNERGEAYRQTGNDKSPVRADA